MVFKVYGENKYVIKDDFTVIDTKTGLEVNKGSSKVSITIFGITREVSKKWLYQLSKLWPDVNTNYKECVFDLVFIKTKTDNVVVVFKEPHYYKKDGNFRIIAAEPSLAINRNGDVINVNNGRKVPTIWVRYPYIRFNLKQLKIHRLVALTWLSNPDWVNNTVVDHIDGNTHNYKYTNLRWLNHKENHYVSLKQGNREDNLIVLVRNINNGEITEHPSLTKACLFIGRSVATTQVTDLEPGRVWKGINGRFEIKLASDKRDWVCKDGESNRYKQPNHNKSKVLFRYNSKVSLYNSIEEAAKNLLDVKIENTREGLTKKLEAKYPGCIVDIQNKEYEAKNIKTGEVITCKTISELCSKLGDEFKKSSIRTYIACNKTFNGYMFREAPFPYTDEWIRGEDAKDAQNSSMAIIATNIDTGVAMRFNSLRSLGAYYGVNKNTMKHYLESRRLFNKKIKLELCPID